MWEGLLRDIRLNFVLDWNEDDVVGEIEIDWIELSGVEEFLQGELPPPHVEYFRFDEDRTFCAAGFLSDYAGSRSLWRESRHLDGLGWRWLYRPFCLLG